MKGNLLLKGRIIRFIILNLLVAIAYAVGVRLSHEFATLPGTVASVWFPSGMTLALVYLLGNRVSLGIIVGSTVALTLGLTKLNLPVTSLIFILIACACGNVAQPIVATYLIKKFSPYQHIFSHVQTVVIYIAAVVFAPTISATFGVTSLAVTQVIKWDGYPVSWITWWLGSALPHLIFTPTLILWTTQFRQESKRQAIEVVIVISLLMIVIWISFLKSYPLAYLFIPVLIWIVFRYGSFFANLLVSIVSLIAILSTAKGYGLYIEDSPNQSLLLLQSFMAVVSLTSLILSAVIDERTAAEISLKKALTNLESLVLERTAELQQSQEQLKQANLELQRLIHIDSLTQIANRRCFDERLVFEWQRLCREQQPLSLLMFDIDYFKRFNDTYGHPMGDKCLTRLAQGVNQIACRSTDLVARYGGEEFVVILPNTDLNGAIMIAEEIQSAVKKLNIIHQNSDISDIVTISIGVSSLIPTLVLEPTVLVQQADVALYRAKQQGRNRFVVFST